MHPSMLWRTTDGTRIHKGEQLAARTIIDRFLERVQSQPDRSALRYRSGDRWNDITWADYGNIVRRAGKGLMSLGLEPGDKMSLLSLNRPEWHFADLACMTIGAVTAPIYVTNSPEQVAHVIGDSDSRVAVVENQAQLDKVLAVRAQLPNLVKVVVIEDHDGRDDTFAMAWDRLLQLGDEVDDARYDEAVAAIGPDDIATLVYTSGTSGSPKGVMLTHGNIWWTATHTEESVPIADADGARTLSYLPLSHIAERMISHLLQIYYGTQTWFGESIQTLQRDLQECKPTYFFGVPRVWEKFYAAFEARMAEADPTDRKVRIAKRAIELGRRVTEAEQAAVAAGGPSADARVPFKVRAQHALLDKLVLHKVRAAFGLEECELPVSASAPLTPELIWFFHSIGIKIAEGYGQSEDNGPTSWNPRESTRIGTVGPPIPGVEVRIADDGEILVRGGNVMAGYYKDDRATKETIDEDGWLHSGDIGEFDENGYLKITDRKKDIIITAGGKNIAPQEIENRVKVHSLISQVVVIGDRRPFLTALVTLDEESAPEWAKEHGIEGDLAAIAAHERTHKEVASAIDDVNAQLAKVEGIKKFRVLERDFLQERNEITPTLKIKRRQINEGYATTIEELYSKDSPPQGVGSADP
jgi:long-chain acyl-CoA synthetase